MFGKVFDGRWKRLGMLASVSACFCYLVAPQPEEPITSGISHNCAFENVVCRTAVPIDIHRQALRFDYRERDPQTCGAPAFAQTRIERHGEQASMPGKHFVISDLVGIPRTMVRVVCLNRSVKTQGNT